MENENNVNDVSVRIDEITRDKKKLLAEIALYCEQNVVSVERENPVEDLQEKLYEAKLILQELSYRLVDVLKDSIEEIESEFRDDPEAEDRMIDMMQTTLIPEILHLINETMNSRLR